MRTINPEYQQAVRDALVKIGAHVQRARKEAYRESRETFAKRLGCTPMTLDRLERGIPVSASWLMAALHVSQTLPDVVDAADPKVLIATLMPIQFPTDFAIPSK